MIIDQSTVIDVAVGNQRRTIESGDAQTIIPNQTLVTLPSQRILTLNTAPGAAIIEDSVLTSLSMNLTNAVGSAGTIVTLKKGFWDLDLAMYAAFDYNWTVGSFNQAFMLILGVGVTQLALITMLPTASTNSPLQQAVFRTRVLMREDFFLQGQWGATTVAQHADIRWTALCNRLV